jgi:hypothetical protein
MGPSIDSAGAGVRAGVQQGTRSTVFGLDVHADWPLLFLAGAPAVPTGRRLDISVAAADVTALDWPDSAELVCDQRESDGTVSFRIEAHQKAGYLISGPAYGSHLLDSDGRNVWCLPGDHRPDAWQRLLVAQVLPFAALLNGLEVLHASAVVIDQGAVALVGRSRAGKTSVALELCRRGASFLADDVLALECAGEHLLGHPGSPVAGLDHAEDERLARVHPTSEMETVAVNDRERLVRMLGAAEPTPLTAIFFLDRSRDGPPEPRFEPADDPQLLLGATFNSVLTTPTRLRRLLEVCALAARVRVERVVMGGGVDAARLGAAIEGRLGGAR